MIMTNPMAFQGHKKTQSLFAWKVPIQIIMNKYIEEYEQIVCNHNIYFGWELKNYIKDVQIWSPRMPTKF